MRISDWSSDVCSSDLDGASAGRQCDVLEAGEIGPGQLAFLSCTAYETVAVELGVQGDAVDFREQRLVLGVEHAALGVAELVGTGLHRQGLHAGQDVRSARHGAVGDRKSTRLNSSH